MARRMEGTQASLLGGSSAASPGTTAPPPPTPCSELEQVDQAQCLFLKGCRMQQTDDQTGPGVSREGRQPKESRWGW